LLILQFRGDRKCKINENNNFFFRQENNLGNAKMEFVPKDSPVFKYQRITSPPPHTKNRKVGRGGELGLLAPGFSANQPLQGWAWQQARPGRPKNC
jgi:hypothetical protein